MVAFLEHWRPHLTNSGIYSYNQECGVFKLNGDILKVIHTKKYCIFPVSFLSINMMNL